MSVRIEVLVPGREKEGDFVSPTLVLVVRSGSPAYRSGPDECWLTIRNSKTSEELRALVEIGDLKQALEAVGNAR